MYARKVAQIADSRRHMRRGCGTLTYRRSRKKGRKAPVVREVQLSHHRQLFLLFLFVVSQFYFVQSSMFDVREISVSGEKKVQEASILEAMGLGEGASYWDLNLQNLQTNVLELNGLKSAKVEVVFPGRVSVRVQERQPVFSLASTARSRHWFTVDQEGVVLAEGRAPKGSLDILLDRPVKVGGILSPDELEVCKYLKEHLSPDLTKRLGSVRFNGRGDVTLRINYGGNQFPVRLGRAERLTYKLFLLEELLISLRAEASQVVSIDLRFSAPVVRHKSKVPPAKSEESEG